MDRTGPRRCTRGGVVTQRPEPTVRWVIEYRRTAGDWGRLDSYCCTEHDEAEQRAALQNIHEHTGHPDRYRLARVTETREVIA